jgi:hypothetical protein
MPEPIFPTLSKHPDAESFKISVPNPSKDGQDTDGGYFITRPKYTRRPPRSFKFQYKDIGQADRVTLEAFWDQVKGSSVAFNWTDPTTNVLHNVRFGKGTTLEISRYGMGLNHRYDTNEITLTEV